MNSDFTDLLSLLNRFQVRYLVGGGYAVMLYTEPRYTKDLDIVIGVEDRDLIGFQKALTEFGFPFSARAREELKGRNRMISLGRAPVRIDIMNELTGLVFEECWQRRNTVNVDGLPVHFLSLEDLIATKRAVGRPQDLMDLAGLELALRPQDDGQSPPGTI
jgi:hypothetical protein